MEGTISKDPADTLLVDLKQIELSYVFDVLNIPVLQFGGEATGKFYVNDLFNSRMLNTDLEVKNFSFNQTPWVASISSANGTTHRKVSLCWEASTRTTALGRM